MLLPGMQKNTPESNETRPDTIDRKIRPFRPNMTWHMTSYLPDLTSQEVNILRKCVKLINARPLKVSWRYNAFYATYLRKTIGGGPFDPPTCASVKSIILPTHSLTYDKSRVGRIFKHHLRCRIIYLAPVTHQYTPKIRSQIFQTPLRSARRLICLSTCEWFNCLSCNAIIVLFE